MKLYAALAFFFVTTSAVHGLRCFTCAATETHSCTDTTSCPVIFNRCFSLKMEGHDIMTKGCQSSIACVGVIQCCEGDLCNSATHTRPNIILLLLLSTSILCLTLKI